MRELERKNDREKGCVRNAGGTTNMVARLRTNKSHKPGFYGRNRALVIKTSVNKLVGNCSGRIFISKNFILSHSICCVVTPFVLNRFRQSLGKGFRKKLKHNNINFLLSNILIVRMMST